MGLETVGCKRGGRRPISRILEAPERGGYPGRRGRLPRAHVALCTHARARTLVPEDRRQRGGGTPLPIGRRGYRERTSASGDRASVPENDRGGGQDAPYQGAAAA